VARPVSAQTLNLLANAPLATAQSARLSDNAGLAAKAQVRAEALVFNQADNMPALLERDGAEVARLWLNGEQFRVCLPASAEAAVQRCWTSLLDAEQARLLRLQWGP
jgi:hypothetical protein